MASSTQYAGNTVLSWEKEQPQTSFGSCRETVVLSNTSAISPQAKAVSVVFLIFNTILSIKDSDLLIFPTSVSAGGKQTKLFHNFLLTGGDGCHRPCFLVPGYFLIYQSHILGDVIFNLKNSFLTIKNKWCYLDFFLTFTSAR